ncbi:MAG: pyruvate kinase, partial [Acidobacteriota bacterium]
KIEKPSAIDNLDSILEVADGVMVARGDMGVELPEEKVPILQKEIIRQANQRGRVVITATQMLESMVEHPRPTRAEASDVANAILDGTDAIMLSAETASGRYPVEALATMARIAEYTETHIGQSPVRRDADSPSPDGSAVTRAVASASCRAAEELSARYVMAFTESGATVRTVSQSRPRPPILGFTPSERVYRRLALRWGVTPVRAGRYDTTDKMLDAAIQFLTSRGLVDPGDVVVVVCGTTTLSGATNMMKILKF